MGDVFRALADPTRRRIIDELRERNGQTLFELCGRLATKHGLGSSRQAIGQHLGVLEDAGLIARRRVGRYTFHDLDTSPLKAIGERWLDDNPEELQMSTGMRIAFDSVFVDDQDKALHFYTEVLGFEKKADIPLGEARWLTVVSPQQADGPELVLEPSDHPAVGPFRAALVADGIPFTAFAVDDVPAHVERMREHGVQFTQEPLQMSPVTTAVFDDTCGNLIQLVSEVSAD